MGELCIVNAVNVMTVVETPQSKKIKDTPKLFGELLVSEGLIDQQHLDLALEEQKREKQTVLEFDLINFLIDQKIIDREQIKSIEDKYKVNKRIGESLVSDGVITQQELDEALASKKEHEFLGEILLKRGLIDKTQLYECLRQQYSVPSFQSLLVTEGIITEREIREIVLNNSMHSGVGEILVRQGAISVQQLCKSMKKHKKRRQIGTMMLDVGLISEEQLDLALEKQKFSDAPLGQTLISENIITDDEFYIVLARQFAMEFQPVDEEFLQSLNTSKLKNLISAKDALRYRVVPLGFVNKDLYLGFFNPLDIEGLESFESIINFQIKLFLVREADYELVYQQIYDEAPHFEDDHDITQMIEDTLQMSLEEDEKESESNYVVAGKDNEAEKLTNMIISYGIATKASDIHIENDPNGTHIRYRVDGIIRELKDSAIRKRLQAKSTAVVSRIKVMADMDIAERRLPQDGGFRLSIYDKDTKSKINLDFRVAICRTVFGENVVIRILDSRKANVRLDQLSHSVTGPTGSGKSSTLYASLHYLNNPGVKIITAEDPVEFKVPGIMQTQAHTKIGLSFAKLLKSFLRMDPDIIMVGEIRDAETAKMAIEAALTGHLVLSSLHTNDAIGSISRLRDFGLTNLQIASSLKGVIAQRLVRSICNNCKQPYMPESKDWNLLFPEEPVHLRFFKGEGCQLCNNSGFSGRIVISELFILYPSIVKEILENGNEISIYTVARNEGMKLMIEDGLDKLDKTTINELIRVSPPDTIDRFRQEYSQLHAQFSKFAPPDGFDLEYQMLLTRTKQGIPKARVHELFTQFRRLRKRLKEPTDSFTEEVFNDFLNSKLNGLANSGKMSEYRISLIYQDKHSKIMVESTTK
jgi:type IV pilus assembly protein PilB